MAFTEQEKLTAWSKAREVDGYDKNMFRKDACGAWIVWSKYGARDNDYGWEIDHIYPVERGGDNHPKLACLTSSQQHEQSRRLSVVYGSRTG